MEHLYFNVAWHAVFAPVAENKAESKPQKSVGDVGDELRECSRFFVISVFAMKAAKV